MKLNVDRVLVVGDTHTHFTILNKFIEKQDYPDVVIVCGDYGWWPHFHNTTGFGGGGLFDQYGVRPGKTKVFWVDGNHENHDDLQQLVVKHGRVPIEVQENVYYCPRGSTIEVTENRLQETKRYLFMGGAESIDKHMRTPGISWWAGEAINEQDLIALPDVPIDVVISHTCPTWIDVGLLIKATDPSRRALDYVFEKYRPRHAFFGHFHSYKTGRQKGCTWRCLGNIEGADRFWYPFVGKDRLR